MERQARLRREVAHSPSQRLAVARGSRDAELEPIRSDDARRHRQPNPARSEDRRWIADTEWLEVSQQTLELVGHVVDRDLGVDPELRVQIFTSELRPRDFVESLGKLLHARCLDRDTGGGAVPAEPHEQVSTLAQTSVQIERKRCPAGALPFVAVERDQHGWSRRLLDDSRRDNADDARVPPLLREHDAVRVVEIERVDALRASSSVARSIS